MRQRSLTPVIAYEVLRALDNPMTPTGLVRVTKKSNQRSAALLKLLEARGWVERCDSTNAGRRDATYYQLTSCGRRLREAAKPLMELKPP